MRSRVGASAALVAGCLAFFLHFTQPASAAVLTATYLFNNNLNAEESVAPALVAVDPLGLNAFETATVFGLSRTVYRLNGTLPSQQAGLTLDTTGLATFNNYSVEIVFEFVENVSSNGWRKVLDPHNISPVDHALFVDGALFGGGNGKLDVWTGTANPGSTTLANNTFHHVVLTNTNTGVVRYYLDGNLENTVSTTVMNIDNLFGFFRDDFQEYSDARVALIRIYDGALSDGDVAAVANDPFAGQPVPEPSTMVTLGIGILGLLAHIRRVR